MKLKYTYFNLKKLEMKTTINVVLTGAVSVGKSTLINSIFTKTFSDGKIKRTTMVPQVYKETEEKEYKFEHRKDILEKNREINKLLIEKSEKGEKINFEEIKEIRHKIPKISEFHLLEKNYTYNFYDTPGLNDARTRDLYFRYLEENFYKFDLVIYVIDIHSGLNTSDEILILQKIIQCLNKNHSSHLGTKFLVIANKCDGMFLQKDGTLKLEEELQEMYQQITDTIKESVNKFHSSPENLKYEILPLSSEDSYIYRMFKKYPDTTLDMKYINKFGFNEYGKSKWSIIPENEKVTKIRDLITGLDLERALKVSGFANFIKTIEKLITPEDQTELVQMKNFYHLGLLEVYQTYEDNKFKEDTEKILEKYEKIKYFSRKNKSKEDMTRFKRIFMNFFETYYQNKIKKFYNKEEDTIDIHNSSREILPEVLEIYENIQTVTSSFDRILASNFRTMKERIKSVLVCLYKNNISTQRMVYVDKLLELGQKAIPFKSLFQGTWFNNEEALIHLFEEVKKRKLLTDNQIKEWAKKKIIERFEELRKGNYLQAIKNVDDSSKLSIGIAYYTYMENYWRKKYVYQDEDVEYILYICKVKLKRISVSYSENQDMNLDNYKKAIKSFSTVLEDYYFSLLNFS